MDGSRACGILTLADVVFAQPALAPLFVKNGERARHRPDRGHAEP
jgi:hypothetical protein